MKHFKFAKHVSQVITIHDLIANKYHRTKPNIAALNPEELLMLREQQETEAVELRKIYPPGKRYFSYILRDDDDYRVLDSLPDEASIANLGAMRLAAGMLANISHSPLFGRCIIPVAMHYNSRVVEFEVDLMVNSVGDTVLYEPFM